MTAALVECAFIDNATDVQAVDEIAEQRAFGVAYAHAVMEFCGIEASDAPAAPTQPEAPAAGGGSGFEGGLYRCMVDVLNVRSAPSLGGAVVAQYRRGETVTLDSWYTVADGYVWGRYTSYSGYTRYIAVGLPTGAPAADDYLLKV